MLNPYYPSLLFTPLYRKGGPKMMLKAEQMRSYGKEDQSLAIDGKTMRNAIDEEGYQTHIMSVVGHQSKACYTQKKSAPCP